MSLQCGIIGLPNVGKSTLFSALTAVQAVAGNYPFTTIDPNVGMVEVPDERLTRLAELYRPKRVVPTTVRFVDIAGLVEGASQGEGLGNRFLSHIRNVDAVAHVLRCFQRGDVVHVSEKLNPLHDLEIIQTELALADLETLQRRVERLEKRLKAGDAQAAQDRELALRLSAWLNEGAAPAALRLSPEERVYAEREYQLLALKPVLHVLNVSESDLEKESDLLRQVREELARRGAEWLSICGEMEAQLLGLSPTEQAEYLKQYGLAERGINRLIHKAYHLLGLMTFFTAGEEEVRAWTVPQGSKAPAAAGQVHSDMERGFIRAEVMSCRDLFALGSAAAVREKGLLRVEGRDYVLRDGDIAYFRFHV